jgi:hypothetical protein
MNFFRQIGNYEMLVFELKLNVHQRIPTSEVGVRSHLGGGEEFLVGKGW